MRSWWLLSILFSLACQLVLGERRALQSPPGRTALSSFPAGNAGKGGIQETIEDLLDLFGFQKNSSVSEQAVQTSWHMASLSPQHD